MTQAASSPTRRVLVVGNPNVGKTTLFNRLTGEDARVGNYPGITVEQRSARLSLAPAGGAPLEVELVDLPGCYSLSARSAEEQVALRAVLGADGTKPDAVLVVVDSGQLLRSAYLALQIAELGLPLVVALNMADEVADAPPSAPAMARLLGAEAVATDGRRGAGLPELRAALHRALTEPRGARVDVRHAPELRAILDRVARALPEAWRGSVERERALAAWALLSLDPDDELDVDPELRRAVLAARREYPGDLELELVAARWRVLDEAAPELLGHADGARISRGRAVSERVDRVLLHPVSGFLVFAATMLLVFQTLFAWAEPLVSLIEAAVAGTQQAARGLLPAGLLADLVADGAIAGVGNVLVFIPQIALLFLMIGLLEDSGYMARAAYLMDRVMRALGLHGRAFVPLLSGHACAVPAILATRTLERRRDRLLTMLVIPLTTCSARLPVYALVITALFSAGEGMAAGLILLGIYLFSILMAMAAAAVLGRLVVRGVPVPLLLELPPYRVPSIGGVLRMVRQRTGSFVVEAGTTILAFSLLLWALLSFPRDGGAAGDPDAGRTTSAAVVSNAQGAEGAAATSSAMGRAAPGVDATRSADPRGVDATRGGDLPGAADEPPRGNGAETRVARSYGGRLGRALEPALEPLGFDWKIGVGILGAFAAREVFVSTLGMVFAIEASDQDQATLRERLRAERAPDGRPRYRPLTGLSLLVFFALACQCMSTLAVVRRESGSWRWAALLFGYMTALAYVASLLVFQIGSALGY